MAVGFYRFLVSFRIRMLLFLNVRCGLVNVCGKLLFFVTSVFSGEASVSLNVSRRTLFFVFGN